MKKSAAFSVLAIVFGVTAVLGTPAEATAQKCAVGTWRLVRAEHKAVYPGYTIIARGGTGERLTIGAGSVRYDFRQAKKIVNTGARKAKGFAGWSQYYGLLTLRASVGAGSHGRIAMSAKSASGNAIYRVVVTSPYNYDTGALALAPATRMAYTDLATVGNGTFACAGDTLAIAERTVYPKRQGGGGTATSHWLYRRI